MSFDEDWPLSYWEGAFRAFESEMGGRQPARIAQCWDLLQRAERLEAEVERLRDVVSHGGASIKQARAEEREACAQALERHAEVIEEDMVDDSMAMRMGLALRSGARLIRARGSYTEDEALSNGSQAGVRDGFALSAGGQEAARAVWFGPTYEARREEAWIAMGRAEERERIAGHLDSISRFYGELARYVLQEAAKHIRARGEEGE